PDTNQGHDGYDRQKSIDDHQERWVDSPRIRYRRWGSRIKLAPDRGTETKNAEQHKHSAGRYYERLGYDICQQCLGPYAARHCDEAGPRPGGICSLRGEYGAVGGQLSASIGAVFNSRRASLHLSRAVFNVDSTGLEFLAGLANLRPCH